MKLPNWVRKYSRPILEGVVGVALLVAGMQLGVPVLTVAGVAAVTAAAATFLPPAEAAEVARVAEDVIEHA